MVTKKGYFVVKIHKVPSSGKYKVSMSDARSFLYAKTFNKRKDANSYARGMRKLKIR